MYDSRPGIKQIVVFFSSLLIVSRVGFTGEPKTVQLSREDVKSMRQLGAFDITDRIELSLGKIFIGDYVSGLLVLENPTNTDIIIKKMNSSCGCSAIYPTSRLIRAGEEMQMAVQMRGSKPGEFDASITIKTNLQDYVIKLNAHGVPRAELVTHEVVANKGKCRFIVVVNDPEIPVDELVALIGEKEARVNFRENNRIGFEVECGDEDHLAILLGTDTSRITPLHLRVKHPGKFKLASTTIYGEVHNDGFRFRLLLIGDHQIDLNLERAEIQIGGIRSTADISLQERGRILFVNARLAEKITGKGIFSLGETEIHFLLRDRP